MVNYSKKRRGQDSRKRRSRVSVSNSALVLLAFGTAFFPRLLTYFGLPSPLNFFHFLVVPVVFFTVIFTTKVKSKHQISIFYELFFASLILLSLVILSALINQAGLANVLLQYMMMIEPFMFLTALLAIPFTKETFQKFRKWFVRFGIFNLGLALAQSILLPIGVYPRRGGTIQDNIAGVFASGSGSAGNYVSCTVSVFLSFYIFSSFKQIPLWIRASLICAAFYQTYISDSKQVLLAFILGFFTLILTKVEEPVKIFCYLAPLALVMGLLVWGLQNPDIEFLNAYRNWTSRAHIYGPEGVAFLTKTAAFRIIPSHYETPLNWLFGLGPGHTVTWLGGWLIKKYASLLAPIGVSIHPVSAEVFQVVWDGWIARQSTIFFPLFTWAGIWGDLGFVGLLAYLYLCSVVWRRVCVDDLGRFMLLTTAVLGFILTQMEEPGQMLTLACLLGLRWHESSLLDRKVS